MIMKSEALITSNADVLGGTPVFLGTRVPIDTLFAHLKAGETLDTFLDDFPSVSRVQAEALLDLTAHLVQQNGGSAYSAR